MSSYKYDSNDLWQNYIYISHLEENGKYYVLPSEPDSISDSMQSNFASENALARSAPMFTYSNSGPRTVQVILNLHRQMLDEANIGLSNVTLESGEDYVDSLINALLAIAVPKYNLTNRAVIPPYVAIRFGQETFIKGVVSGSVTKTSEKPILANGKWAKVQIQFNVSEMDPYDAMTIANTGTYRGTTSTLSGLLDSAKGEKKN